jgi:DNA-binding CsgD family transcriptional regulator
MPDFLPSELSRSPGGAATRLEPTPTCLTLAQLWGAIAAGAYEITSDRTTDTHCYLMLRERPCARVEARVFGAAIVEKVLSGVPLKATAFDLDRAGSTVSWKVQKWLRHLGLHCSLKDAPLLLAIAGSGNREVEGRVVDVTCMRDGAGRFQWIAGTARPDAALEPRLTRAEYRVARLIVEGKSHRELAAARGTSVRTIANQIGAVFRKLGVSGRFELLALALRSFYAPSKHHESLRRRPLPEHPDYANVLPIRDHAVRRVAAGI